MACLLALALAAPSVAFGQGAGDDQYQDPFGGGTAQSGNGGNAGGGLSDTPPGGGGSGSGNSSSGKRGGHRTTTTPEATRSRTPADHLPNTGSDPLMLALFGAALVMMGVGLRLRTIDPDDY